MRDEQADGDVAARLERAVRLHEAVLDSTTQGIYGLDRSGVIYFANRAAAELLGYEVRELIGARAHATFHHTRPDGGAYPLQDCPILSTLEHETIQRREDELFWRKDGTSFWVEYTATPIRGDPSLHGAIVTFSDISQRRAGEDRLAGHAERLAALTTIGAAGARARRRAGQPAVATALRTQPPSQIIRRAVELAREQLGMELAFLSAIVDGEEVVRTLDGEAASFGLRAGTAAAIEDTYCGRVVSGELPNIVVDARCDARVRDLALTRELAIGAYVGVPLEIAPGRIYGMLCCLSHSARPGLDERDLRFLQTFGSVIADQLAREELESETRRLHGQATTAAALIAALEARDHYTSSHSELVVELADAVCHELALPAAAVEDAKRVALLHDIGKVGVPDAVLQKPGRLDPLEWQVMKQHPAIGERIIADVPALSHLAAAVRAEHEHWDGSGYPDGLAGEQIPLASRITLGCDAFHAMTSDRPYRPAMATPAALAELRANAGGQFDPAIVDALVRIIEGPTL